MQQTEPIHVQQPPMAGCADCCPQRIGNRNGMQVLSSKPQARVLPMLAPLQEAESAQRQYVQLRREHEALQNRINSQVCRKTGQLIKQAGYSSAGLCMAGV